MNNEETLCNVDTQKKKSKVLKGVGTAVGGSVLGSGATMAGQAFAAQTAESNETVAPEAEPVQQQQQEQQPEDIKVAITTDDQSFGEAFAAAREQVGAGGVFEWHGKLYNTFTKDEWEEMTPEQQQEFAEAVQPHIDSMPEHPQYATTHHQEAVHHQETAHHQEAAHHQAPASDVHTDHPQSNDNDGGSTAMNTDGTDTADVDSEIQVISVQHDVDVNGDQVDIAVVSIDGHGGMIIDVDQDGTADVAIIDVNDNNQIDDNEIADISDIGYQMPQQTPGDAYMANAEDMPDYVNDATV